MPDTCATLPLLLRCIASAGVVKQAVGIPDGEPSRMQLANHMAVLLTSGCMAACTLVNGQHRVANQL